MPINPDAVGNVSQPKESSWTSKDTLLYALGVGAGATDPTGFELEFTTENTRDLEQKALPTMGVVLAMGGGSDLGIGSYNPALMVHGEQGIELHRPVPVAATITSTTKVAGIYDKGKAALVVFETTACDAADGEPLFTNTTSLFMRGEGGWGGDRGPSSQSAGPPDRDPDHVVSYTTRPDQALLYRLNGDRNPLHSDPAFAADGGFEKPILHGLCTYGFTGRALLHACCGSDPSRFKSMSGRFSSPVIPGETLDIKIWLNGEASSNGDTANGDAHRTAFFQTHASDRIVLDNGHLGFTD